MSTPNLAKKEPTIRKVYNPQGKELDTLRHVYQRYWDMRDARQGTRGGYNFESDWDKWEKQWNAYRPPKDSDDWKSNIFIPITTSVIEAQLSEIIEQTLRPWVIERGAEDEAKARVMNAIVEYTWENAKSDIALFEIARDALIFGTGIGMEYYWRQPRVIKNAEGKEQKIFEFDDCYLEPVRLWDFFVDEKAQGFTGPKGAADCIRRYIMEYDDFRLFFQGKEWDTFGAASLVKPGGDTNYYEFYSPPERIDNDRQVEVLWYWNKPDDLLGIVANDVLVTAKPNPYRHKELPFVKINDIKRPYQFYGKGEAELLESLQEEINTLRRMTIDRNHLDIDKPVFVDDTLTIEDEDTITRPHGIIPVGDTGKIKFAEYSDIPLSVFKQLEMLSDDKVRVTGMDERLEGVSTGGTATEAAILKEATLKRLNMKIWQMKNDALIDIGRLRVENILQFYSQPKLEKIVGEAEIAKAEKDGLLIKTPTSYYKANYRQIRLRDQKFDIDKVTGNPTIKKAKGNSYFQARPEWFLPKEGGFDIRFKASSTIPLSKPLEQQKADELYDRLARNPTVDPWKLAEFLLKSREVDPDDFKLQPQQTGGNEPEVNLQKMVDLAGVENAEMMRGNLIKATPYASQVHTEIHVEFMNSENFKKEASEEVLKIFSQHVVGELLAEKLRGGQPQPQGLPGGGGQAMPTGMGVSLPSNGEIPGGAGQVTGQMEGGADTQNVSGAQSQ